MPHITTFDGLIAGPDKIANQLDGSQIEQAELMEHAPKDSEYGGEGHGDVNNSDNPVGSSVITYIFAPSAEMYSFGECESLDSCLEPMLDQLSSDSILFQSENQLLSN